MTTDGASTTDRSHDHDQSARSRSPFADAVPALLAAGVYGVAAVVWVVAGPSLPGGRWLAVHLFTLGVLTNAVLAFSDHFGRTLTRSSRDPARWVLPVANLGTVLVLVGLPTATPAAVGTGGLLVTVAVTASWWRLRAMRHDALGARFTWVVRAYERAHGAFVHGALLGVLLGTGVLGGRWYGAGRLAHLHVTLLGWGGLTLLATIVFFGPTIARTRIEPGADERAARVTRIAATALTIAVLMLLATGVGRGFAGSLRVSAAASLAVVAVVVTVVCRPVGTAALGSRATVLRWPVVAVAAWFPLVVWLDVAVVATGAWRLADAVGLGFLLGVLVQAILATAAHVAPLLRERGGTRERVRARVARGATVRAAVFNLGVAAAVVAAVLGGPEGVVVARIGWVLVVVTLAWLAVAVAPLRRAAAEHRT